MPRLPKLLFPLLIFFLLSACAGNNFDEATIPPEQVAAEMAFKRMADHGGIEPVIEIGQEIKDWQFHIGAYSKMAYLGGEPTVEYTFGDLSGIKYTVSSESTSPKLMNQLETGMYGYATGRFVSVERDLAGGKVYATVELTDWRERR
ncbi:hypothetical protein [Neolewinella persica]|uniref:hypothetical protein n=1 Tax=Neolewinella persica TaxID=70998 RepID=UPI00035F24C7|nr:hypothetical protein [Neolewinella persica]